MKKKVTVLLEVKPVAVEVEVEKNATDTEILAVAKQAYIEKIKQKFPSVTYSIAEGKVLDFSNTKIGQVVLDKPNGKHGVIIKINKKTIQVAFPNGILQGSPAAFTPSEENVDVESITWTRSEEAKKLNFWVDGNVGYLAIPNEKKIVPVVLAKVTPAGKYHLYAINGNGNSYYNLTSAQVQKFLFDTKKEAEKFLKNNL